MGRAQLFGGRANVPDNQRYRPVQSPLDPNLTILPAISAPVDEGVFIPYPPRSRWAVLLTIAVLVGLTILALYYFFLRASAFG